MNRTNNMKLMNYIQKAVKLRKPLRKIIKLYLIKMTMNNNNN